MQSRILIAALAMFLVLATVPGGVYAQEQAPRFELTIQNIMLGPAHVGQPPSNVQWSDDGQWVYFRWTPGGGEWDDPAELYRVTARGGDPELVPRETSDSLAFILAGGELSPDGQRRLITHRGDIYIIDRRDQAIQRITQTRGTISSPSFSQDGRTIFFTEEGNLFALSLDGGELRQLTDIRTAAEQTGTATATPRTDRQRFLTDQQRELFEFLQRQAERRRTQTGAGAPEPILPRTIRLGNGERLADLSIEPGGRWAMLRATRGGSDSPGTIVPNFVTGSGYTENLNTRAKVGSIPGDSRLGLITLETAEVRWLELGPPSPTTADRQPGDGAASSFVGWNRDGTLGLAVTSSHDNKQRWLHIIAAETGEVTEVAHDQDEAWLAGPCSGCRGWLPDGQTVYFVSERDGWAHLYLVGADGAGLRQLTTGAWEVRGVAISPDEQTFYLHTSEVSPFENHFYHMALDGEQLTRITNVSGLNNATPAPDGRNIAVVYSYANRPPELFVVENRPGASPAQVTNSPTAEWRSYAWIAPHIVHFEASDGVMVPARIYRPEDVGARPNGAGVIFVHGAGYLQNVHQGWSTYYREYMFHHLLATRGFTVLDIDYRASAGYGRDWRTAIYRYMGDRDLDDHVDGARYLSRSEGVDSARIGIYGGSYGGFITLMALFTRQDYFAAGAALRSVTDWAHYNHGYTGRILNFPQTDEEAYRRSSPIYFAEGLRAPLLITHGMIDRNVHFQDVVRLAQRLIELGKTDWEMAVYPIEDHAFVYPSSWADQYRRIHELFERHLAGSDSAERER